MITLKIFGRKNEMSAKFNRDKYMTKCVDINERDMVLRTPASSIYYRLAAPGNLQIPDVNFIETYGDTSISNECWETIRKILK